MKLSRELLHEIQSADQLIIQMSLDECRKTALIMPDYISRDVYKTLATKRKVVHAFIGEETFSDVDWMFYISGFVPSFLTKRIYRTGECGIWKW